MDIRELFEKDYIGKNIKVQGWIRNHRKQKDFGFIDFSDGTCFEHLQIVYDNSLSNFDDVSKFLVGCAIEVEGKLVESQGKSKI